MKKFAPFIVVVFVVLLFGVTAYADQMNQGCDLGTIIFKGKEGLLSQICAVTTNGTFGNQTFGITSGTSECERAVNIVSIERLNKFVAENMDNLAKDIAQGQGEYLSTLAVLMEVPEGERAVFYANLKNHFSDIYTSDQVTHLEILENIETVTSSS